MGRRGCGRESSINHERQAGLGRRRCAPAGAWSALPWLVGALAASLLWLAPSQAQAYRIPVSIESTPPGAKVYLDSEDGQVLGTTPIRVARIDRGRHTLIFKLKNHETAKLEVDIRRRRETFRAVLNPLGKLVVTPGNSAANGAAVVVDGEPVGNIPFQQTMQPGRHQVQIKREGHEPFEQWVSLEGGQTFTLPVSLEQKAPDTGSILVAGDVTGAAVYLDGEPKGATPTVLEDVPAGEHELEIRPDGMDAHKETVRVRAGERTSITPTLRRKPKQTGRLRVVTSPAGASVTVDGEDAGTSPASVEDLSPGDHIVEVSADGYEPARKTVAIESGQQRVVSLEMKKKELRPGRVVVNATVDDAQVLIDGQEKGQPPVVIEEAPSGTHAIVVEARGYKTFRTTCEVRRGRDCEIMARMEPVGTPVRVEANTRKAQLYVDGRLVGPVPWEGELPVGAHRIEVKADGFQEHVAQVNLRHSSEPRVLNVELLREGEEAPEERLRRKEERIQELKESVSYSAAPLPVDMTTLDVSVGWPYIVEARFGVGILEFLEAGFAMRTFGRLTEFEGRAKAGWRPIRQLALGVQTRFGGGIGPTRGSVDGEEPNAGSHPTNSLFMSLELLTTLHFSRAGASTLWLAADMYSDRWDWEADNKDLLYSRTNATRQKQSRLRLGGALELVISRRWNVFGLLEGIILDPSQSRRILGDVFNLGGKDTELYFRLGFTYKFGSDDISGDLQEAAEEN